jgi:hypothetical protein
MKTVGETKFKDSTNTPMFSINWVFKESTIMLCLIKLAP